MITFNDVAHLYIGCNVKTDDNEIGKLIGIVNNNGIIVKHIQQKDEIKIVLNEVIPILKSIEEMTDEQFDENYLKFEEMEKDCIERIDTMKCMAAMYTQLCKDGYDVFRLIESNQAIC